MSTSIITKLLTTHNTPVDGRIYADANMRATAIRFEKGPHWQVHGKGSLYLHAYGNVVAKWLSFDITESAEKSAKRVMFTLGADHVRQVRDLMNEVLDEKPEGYPGIAHDFEIMRNALRLIAGSENFKGGTSVKELRDIAKRAVAGVK